MYVIKHDYKQKINELDPFKCRAISTLETMLYILVFGMSVYLAMFIAGGNV